jgi:primase-polymerase (primpol)-like protein
MFNKGGFDGIGFVLTGHDPYVGMDIDNCRDPNTGKLDYSAQAIIKMLNSYTEISPSGEGIRIFIKAEIPAKGRKKFGIELYGAKRYLTVTGHHFDGSPTAIEERKIEAKAFFDSLLMHKTSSNNTSDTNVSVSPSDLRIPLKVTTDSGTL